VGDDGTLSLISAQNASTAGLFYFVINLEVDNYVDKTTLID